MESITLSNKQSNSNENETINEIMPKSSNTTSDAESDAAPPKPTLPTETDTNTNTSDNSIDNNNDKSDNDDDDNIESQDTTVLDAMDTTTSSSNDVTMDETQDTLDTINASDNDDTDVTMDMEETQETQESQDTVNSKDEHVLMSGTDEPTEKSTNQSLQTPQKGAADAISNDNEKDADKDNENDNNEEDSQSDSDDDDSNSSSSESEEEEEEEEQSQSQQNDDIPTTDENGRQLSAYEIMRLERIKRNREKLAQLGLQSGAGGDQGMLSPHVPKKKKKKPPPKKDYSVLPRRQTMSRKSKTKDLNYNTPANYIYQPMTPSSEKKGMKPTYTHSDDATSSQTVTATATATTNTTEGAEGTTTETASSNNTSSSSSPPKLTSFKGPNGKNTRKEKQVPLFVYKELKRIESERKQNFKKANQFVRHAETELRHSTKQLKHATKRKQKAQSQKIKKNELNDRKALGPLVQEFTTRKQEIHVARKKLREHLEQRHSRERKKEEQARSSHEAVKESYPMVVRNVETTLDQMLLEHLPLGSDDVAGGGVGGGIGRGKKKRGRPPSINKKRTRSEISKSAALESIKANNEAAAAAAAATTNTNPTSLSNATTSTTSATTTANKPNASIQKKALTPTILEPEDMKKMRTKTVKARNVGGPVSANFSKALQRKWLENDVPMAANAGGEFVPQIGDVVLYYPTAHYKFLQVYPDIRCKKSRLILRIPLWKRAKDEAQEEKESIAAAAKALPGETPPTPKIPWYTPDWASNIESGECSYPILCKVERTIAEFPYDTMAMEEKQMKKKAAKAKKAKLKQQQKDGGGAAAASGGKKKKKENDDDDGEDSDGEKRKIPRRDKPYMAMGVTLRPLAPILPPRKSNKSSTGILFEEEITTLPPTFSVLIFPSDQPDFLIPFCWAYRMGMSLSDGENVKFQTNTGDRLSGTIASSSQHHENGFIDSSLDFFGDILCKNINDNCMDPSKLDTMIYETYCSKTSTTSTMFLPEDDLRSAIQVGLYQHYRKKGPKSTRSQAVGKLAGTEMNNASGTGVVLVSNLVNWVRVTMPRWEGTKVLVEGREYAVSPWNLSLITNDSTTQHNELLTAALAPRVLMSPTETNNGDFIYSIDEQLRDQLEVSIQHFLNNNEKAASFIAPITEHIAPGYKAYVPTIMSFRKIFKRLKPQQMKQTRQKQVSNDDPTIQQATKDTVCCYYRSTASLISDIHDIFQNCLLYNAPACDIVLAAVEVTHQLKLLIEKVESLWLRDKMKRKLFEKEEQDQRIRQPSDGLDNWTTNNLLSLYRQLPKERIDFRFNAKLSHEWINGSGDHWIPQCGDKILYNHYLHGQFIVNNLIDLTMEQSVIPPVMPSQKEAKQVDPTQFTKDMKDCEETHYWMLGTVVWTRYVFPRDNSSLEGKENGGLSFDCVAPLLAVGIQFQYSWLSKQTQVVYWRPFQSQQHTPKTQAPTDVPTQSSSNLEKSGAEEDESQGLLLRIVKSAESSFILPAWESTVDSMLPPFPASSAKIEKPEGLSRHRINSISQCLDALRQKCVDNTLFDLKGKGQMQSENTKNRSEATENGDGDNCVAGNTSRATLSQIYFNTPSSHIAGDASESDTQALHQSILPHPYLSLHLIQENLKSGMYRSHHALEHDIREAFLAAATYVLKSSSIVNDSSAYIYTQILKACASNRLSFRNALRDGCLKTMVADGVTKKVKISNGKVGINLGPEVQVKGVKVKIKLNDNQEEAKVIESNIMRFNQRQSELIHRLLTIRKLYAMALLSVEETSVSHVVLQLQSSTQQLSPATVKSQNARSDQEIAYKNCSMILSSLTDDKLMFRKPLSKKNEPLPTVRIRVRMDNFSTSHELKKSEAVTDQQSKSQTSASNDSVHETLEQGDEIIDLSQAIKLEPQDYENDKPLSQALFGRPNRRQPCVRCKVNRQSFLTCRVRRAHSNKDFIFLEYLRNVGGVDGYLRLLNPAYCGQILSIADYTHVSETQETMSETAKPLSLPNEKKEVDNTDEAANAAVTTEQNVVKKESNVDQRNENTEKYRKEMVEKATRALILAKSSLVAASSAIKSKLRMSDDFIEENFPVDPLDGHYEMCIYCGLGGDVLCCENCPTVCHPHCVGLDVVPDGDWYCDKCMGKKALDKGSKNQKKEIKTSKCMLSSPDNNKEEKSESKKDTFADSNKTTSDAKAFNEGEDSPINDDKVNGDTATTSTIVLTRTSAKEEASHAVESLPSKEVHTSPAYSTELEDLLECLKKQRRKDTPRRERDRGRGSAGVQSDKSKTLNDGDLNDFEMEHKDLSEMKTLGSKVMKMFDNEYHLGEIVTIPSETHSHFKVKYEDGDEEDLSEDELEDFLKLYMRRQRAKSIRKKAARKFGEVGEAKLDNSSTPVKKRGRGRPRKSEQTIYNEDVINASVKKRPRGRPRKREPEHAEPEASKIEESSDNDAISVSSSTRRRRGRPERFGELVSTEAQTRSRTRRNKQTTSPQKQKKRKQNNDSKPPKSPKKKRAKVDLSKISLPNPTPDPGRIDESLSYYCTKENDTCATVARKIGCQSWSDIAFIPENQERFGKAIENAKTRFRKGSMLRIPETELCNYTFVFSLAEVN